MFGNRFPCDCRSFAIRDNDSRAICDSLEETAVHQALSRRVSCGKRKSLANLQATGGNDRLSGQSL